jgi:hypothetical protein
MRRLLLGVPLIVGLGVSATHATAETISEGMNSPTFGVFSQGSLGSGSWSGEIQSQGMMMSNGIIYSQGMEIPDFSGEGPPIATDTSDVSSPHGNSADTMNYSITDISSPHSGSDVSGGSGSDVSGSVDNNPSPSTDPFSPQLPGFAGILDGGTDGGPGRVESFNVNSFDFPDPDKHDPPPRSVPEPMTLTLLGTTLLGFGLIRRRKA